MRLPAFVGIGVQHLRINLGVWRDIENGNVRQIVKDGVGYPKWQLLEKSGWQYSCPR